LQRLRRYLLLSTGYAKILLNGRSEPVKKKTQGPFYAGRHKMENADDKNHHLHTQDNLPIATPQLYNQHAKNSNPHPDE